MDETLTRAEAAALLGITPRSLYRWIDEGRLPHTLRRAELLDLLPSLSVRPRGPQRNPRSKRYTVGRHTFDLSRPTNRKR